MAKVKDELMNHDYDGIQEYDNDLPGWWKNLFYITIVFAVIYLGYYHIFGVGDSSDVKYLKEVGEYVEPADERGLLSSYSSPYQSSEDEEHLDDVEMRYIRALEGGEPMRIAPTAAGGMTASTGGGLGFDEYLSLAYAIADDEQRSKLVEAFPDKIASFDDLLVKAMAYASGEDLARITTAFPELAAKFVPETPVEEESHAAAPAADLKPLTDEASLAGGKQVWDSQCFTCHMNDGGGGIGPNMTDEYWIHGGTFPDIIRIINVGVPAKGMIPWRGTLSPDQIHQVASYLLTFQGTTPANPKAPEGEKKES